QRSGSAPDVTPEQQADARADLEYWAADVVVLKPGRNTVALRNTVNALLGFDAEFHDGVWVWDVRTSVF
ncbi:MAG: glycosyl transferase, partial [Rhodococcus sp. (in: high G+C Gram-positive bacteria)]